MRAGEERSYTPKRATTNVLNDRELAYLDVLRSALNTLLAVCFCDFFLLPLAGAEGTPPHDQVSGPA